MATGWHDRCPPSAQFDLESGPRPKHAQLREILRRRVQTELPAGAPIPSERELAESYQISRLTVRAAVGKLVEEGLLARVRGRGTFTVGQRVQAPLHVESLSEDFRRRGYAVSTEVLTAERRPLAGPVAVAYGLAESQPGYYLARLHRADGVPLAVERGWYNPRVAPGLLEFDRTSSVYSQLAENCDVLLDHVSQTVRSESADAETAELLDVPVGSPLLVLRRVVSAAGVPVEDMTSAYRSDLHQMTMQLGRNIPGPGQRPSHGGSR